MTEPPTLENFAYRIAGPIDAAINATLNTAIPWYFVRGVESVPWLGLPSFYAFVGPMVFCATFFPAMMGYRNGVKVLGATERLPAWQRRAWLTGLTWAIVTSAVLGVIVYVVHRALPDLRVSSLATILIDGLGSAVLSYFVQVGGIFAARRDIHSLPS